MNGVDGICGVYGSLDSKNCLLTWKKSGSVRFSGTNLLFFHSVVQPDSNLMREVLHGG
jgi:hypothetical protein